MEPQDIPFIICGIFCLIPIAAGLLAWLIPFLFAKRLPVVKASRWNKNSRKNIQLELSLESRQDVRQQRKAKKQEQEP